jgi:hypothetical protein
VNEDVFAYSNRYGDERTLVVYNNRYAEATGSIRRSVGMNMDSGGRRHIVHKGLAEGLGLRSGEGVYYVFRDEKGGLEYLRSSRSLWNDGLMVHLGAFKCHVFTSFRELHDTDGRCARLEGSLMGRGVPDVMRALKELSVEPVLAPFRDLVSPEGLRRLVAEGMRLGTVPVQFSDKVASFLARAGEFARWRPRSGQESDDACLLLDVLFSLDRLRRKASWKRDTKVRALVDMIPEQPPEDLAGWRLAVLWALVSRIGRLGPQKDPDAVSAALMEDWLLGSAMASSIAALGVDQGRAGYEVMLVRVLTRYQSLPAGRDMGALLRDMLSDTMVRDLLGFNLFEEKWWFNKEAMENLVSWTALLQVLQGMAGRKLAEKEIRDLLREAGGACMELLRIVEASGFEAVRLASLLPGGQAEL